MDPIKEAFRRIKYDISSLQDELFELKREIDALKSLKKTPTVLQNNQTMPTQNQTHGPIQTDNPTQNQTHEHQIYKGNYQNSPSFQPFSTGNGGVPTDRQTDRQTDNEHLKFAQSRKQDRIDEFEKANEVLESLDNIKKEIRLKFKRLTSQEMLVFSTLYKLQEQRLDEITYKILANNLNLSESSIRDYINKLISKGVPVLKIRQNNKKIALKVSHDLQKIASLSTIIQLRDL